MNDAIFLHEFEIYANMFSGSHAFGCRASVRRVLEE